MVDVLQPTLCLDGDVFIVAVVGQEAVCKRNDDGVERRHEVGVLHIADRVVASVEVVEECRSDRHLLTCDNADAIPKTE